MHFPLFLKYILHKAALQPKMNSTPSLSHWRDEAVGLGLFIWLVYNFIIHIKHKSKCFYPVITSHTSSTCCLSGHTPIWIWRRKVIFDDTGFFLLYDFTPFLSVFIENCVAQRQKTHQSDVKVSAWTLGWAANSAAAPMWNPRRCKPHTAKTTRLLSEWHRDDVEGFIVWPNYCFKSAFFCF